MRSAVLVIAAAAACSGNDDGDRTVTVTPPPAPVTVVAPVDASMSDGATELPDTDPSMHLDPDEGDVGTSEQLAPRARSRRLLEILLRSTPSGATAVVDGKVVGVTPTYWEGEFTGRARDFTFVLPGHALARYKFVPIQNGIVHARLTPVLSLPGATPPIVPPAATTPPPKPRPATPTVVTPDAETPDADEPTIDAESIDDAAP